MYEFSPVEIQTVKALLSTKTDQEIADILETPLDVLQAKILELVGSILLRNEQVNNIIELRAKAGPKQNRNSGHDAAIAARLREKKKKEEAKVKKQKEVNLRELERVKRNREREGRRTYKTKLVDLTQLISVRIDRKTTVFVKPGTDIEKIKKQYTRPSLLDGIE